MKPFIPGLIIIFFIIIIYIPSSDIYLRGDDFEWLASSYPGWQNPSELLELINHFFRPMVKFFYLLDFTFFGTNIFFYNATTLLFHLVNVFLLYWLMYRVFRRIGPAAMIALVFGVSSMYSEVTLWSAGRPDSILLMFMLGALICIDKLEFERMKNWGFQRETVGIIVLTLLAVCSKETWILLPFLAFLFLWVVKRFPFKKVMQSTVPLFLLLGLFIGLFIVLPILSGTRSPTAYAGLSIDAAMKKLGYLLFKYVGFGDSFTGAWWQFGMVFLVLGALTYLLFRRKNRPALFGLLWMLITIAISLPIRYAPSRYNYLPLLGFWVLVVALLEVELKELAQRFKIKKAISALVVGLAVLFYTSYQVIMLQWEIKDYRRWGETHRQVAEMYLQVRDQIPNDRPIVFIDLGTRKAVQEAADSAQGYRKLLFVRETAIWQQVTLSALDSFLGDPFNEVLEPVPHEQLSSLLESEFTALVFTDSGFFISNAHHGQVRDYFRRSQTLPYKVEALQWLKR
jgi:hypothetical protein